MTKAKVTASSLTSVARGPQAGGKDRGPPKAIHLLLPVWGTQFIGQFLEISLPTLLAPGNLPSLVKSLPSKLTLLTNSEGAEVLRNHPAIHYLQNICKVEFNVIDDLITGDNYSTTITLAYARAVQAAGDEMLDTCFFFLISDYIMADGSLANVLAKMMAGYSAAVAGNFQVAEEAARISFFDKFDTGSPEIIISARELVSWAINRLHPMTLANMVNFPLCHSIHSNRLFWRVDESTLIGRFYLMHMICIRPETTDFVIGSSCDYSFIPEMCPSGNVHVLTDSDEYLVIEMQKRRHESSLVCLGGVDQQALTGSLAEWTTATHRKNAHSAVIYHASNLPSNLDSILEESESYIEAIERKLPSPQPYRDHHYWLGAIAAHRWAVIRREEERNSSHISEEATFRETGLQAILFRFRDFVFGRPPHVRRWHPRWPDYRMIGDLARLHFAGGSKPLLIVSSSSSIFQNWLSGISPFVVSLDLSRLLSLNSDQYGSLIEKYSGCLLVLRETETTHAQELIGRIKSLLTIDSRLVIFVLNGYGVAVGPRFTDDLLREISLFFDPDMSFEDARFVPAGWVTWIALRGMRNAMILMRRNLFWTAFAGLAATILIVVSFICNLGRRRAFQAPRNQVFSSLGLVMRKTSVRLGEVDAVEVAQLDRAARRYQSHSAMDGECASYAQTKQV